MGPKKRTALAQMKQKKNVMMKTSLLTRDAGQMMSILSLWRHCHYLAKIGTKSTHMWQRGRVPKPALMHKNILTN